MSSDSTARGAQRERPDCWQCAHYFITHEVSFPYGCRAMNFKSRKPPCLEVLETSGSRCLVFLKKETA